MIDDSLAKFTGVDLLFAIFVVCHGIYLLYKRNTKDNTASDKMVKFARLELLSGFMACFCLVFLLICPLWIMYLGARFSISTTKSYRPITYQTFLYWIYDVSGPFVAFYASIIWELAKLDYICEEIYMIGFSDFMAKRFFYILFW